MFKKTLSLFLALSLVIAILPAYAQQSSSDNILTDTIQIGDETVSYKYKEKDGIITYIEIEDDVIENVNNDIFLNGVKVASYTETRASFDDIGSSISPRTGWTWSDSGNRSNYIYQDSITRNITLENTLKTIGITTLSAIILIFLPEKLTAASVAAALIDGVSAGYTAYQDSMYVYSTEDTYKHKDFPLSFAKMIDYKYYYDRNLTDENTSCAKTLYGFWG